MASSSQGSGDMHVDAGAATEGVGDDVLPQVGRLESPCAINRCLLSRANSPATVTATLLARRDAPLIASAS